MSGRRLTVLGTASQAPTRERAGGGYALRWDDQLLLFDPAEGFQRQCLLAHVAIGRATAVCITHFHGDHCLGLPGIIHRRALSQCEDRLPVYYPAGGQEYYDRLTRSSVYDHDELDPRPVSTAGVIGRLGSSVLSSEPLDHRVPTVGYRLQEPDRLGLDARRLDRLHLRGPRVGELLRRGSVAVDGRVVTLDEVTERRPGQAFAFIMDTAPCEGATRLARGVDLLVCEATYLERDRALAEQGRHLTARQAGDLARRAGARRLVLTHYSGRYPAISELVAEAAEIHDDVVGARDLEVVEVPARRRGVPARGPARG